MEVISILVAAAGAYVFGAFWYMRLGDSWIRASGVALDENGRPVSAGIIPYITSAIAVILVAGMMRHMFGMAGIDSLGKGLVAGLGLGAFIAAPWIVTNYTFADRSRMLMLIDGGYAVIGCAIIGTILTLF
jgi:uncharacterized protein DUF1761